MWLVYAVLYLFAHQKHSNLSLQSLSRMDAGAKNIVSGKDKFSSWGYRVQGHLHQNATTKLGASRLRDTDTCFLKAPVASSPENGVFQS